MDCKVENLNVEKLAWKVEKVNFEKLNENLVKNVCAEKLSIEKIRKKNVKLNWMLKNFVCWKVVMKCWKFEL